MINVKRIKGPTLKEVIRRHNPYTIAKPRQQGDELNQIASSLQVTLARISAKVNSNYLPAGDC